MNADRGVAESSAASTWELLIALGFRQDDTVISDPPPGLSLDFGNVKLSASRGVNRFLAPVVLLTGVLATKRSIAEVLSEIPLDVESVEQGLAWVVWSLDNAAGGTFEPASAPAWVAEGRRHRHLLPWERGRAAYAARPHCHVRRDSARAALKALAEQLRTVDDDLLVTFGFDGSVLTVACAGKLSAMAAEGDAWPRTYSIRAGSLKRLPKRLMNESIEFAIWESALTIGSWRYAGAFAAGEAEQNP